MGTDRDEPQDSGEKQNVDPIINPQQLFSQLQVAIRLVRAYADGVLEDGVILNLFEAIVSLLEAIKGPSAQILEDKACLVADALEKIVPLLISPSSRDLAMDNERLRRSKEDDTRQLEQLRATLRELEGNHERLSKSYDIRSADARRLQETVRVLQASHSDHLLSPLRALVERLEPLLAENSIALTPEPRALPPMTRLLPTDDRSSMQARLLKEKGRREESLGEVEEELGSLQDLIEEANQSLRLARQGTGLGDSVHDRDVRTRIIPPIDRELKQMQKMKDDLHVLQTRLRRELTAISQQLEAHAVLANGFPPGIIDAVLLPIPKFTPSVIGIDPPTPVEAVAVVERTSPSSSPVAVSGAASVLTQLARTYKTTPFAILVATLYENIPMSGGKAPRKITGLANIAEAARAAELPALLGIGEEEVEAILKRKWADLETPTLDTVAGWIQRGGYLPGSRSRFYFRTSRALDWQESVALFLPPDLLQKFQWIFQDLKQGRDARAEKKKTP